MGNRQSRPWTVSDELGSLVEPLLPKPGPRKAEGRPRVPDRQALCGIPFILHTGIQWEYLPQGLAGLRLGDDVLAASCGLERGRRLGPAPPTAAERAAVEEPAGPGTGGDRLLPRTGRPTGPKSGTSPVDRARPGSKHHLIVDGQGIPLAMSLSRGTATTSPNSSRCSTRFPPSPDGSADPADAPTHCRPTAAYDHDKYRRLLRQRGIRPVIARRSEPHGTGLGTFRYIVERTIAWLHGFRRLRIRWERRDDIHEAFLGLATCLITHRHVRRLCWDLLTRVRLPLPQQNPRRWLRGRLPREGEREMTGGPRFPGHA
ncbi:transposase [Streptomyces sp. NPDC003781]|uniref:transposase n=1 Tax=Streptomyces sp. NPDC003781 TaxID=3364686 RepID=UPI00367CEA97